MTKEEAALKYGPIVNGKWPDEAKWCSSLSLPSQYTKKWINSYTGSPISHIYMNKDMQQPFLKALLNLQFNGWIPELRTFDGCYVVRDVRGEKGSQSWHSWGMAIDINAKENPLGGPVAFSEGFLNCFRNAGFTCGADFSRLDGMHFQFGEG